MHLALGGCLGAPPVRFGLTSDTGGHIAYILDAAAAQAALPRVAQVSIVTRLFEDPLLGPEFARPQQSIGPRITIDRIATTERRYLEKEALSAHLPALSDAFCAYLASLPVRPDVIHAHFADAAQLATIARRRFGIPFVYTPHALGIDKRWPACPDQALETRIQSERQAIANADAMIVSTRDEADRQVAAYRIPGSPARLECLPPGVPENALHASNTPPTSLDTWFQDPAKPIILAIARPVRKKNLAALPRALAATESLADRANLVILAGQHGHGLRSPEEREIVAELKRLANTPPLRGRVALPPTHTAADVHALYHQAAAGGVFVNPALHEPFGLTLIEAAAMRVPVVATRNGGPVDIIAAIGHGLLIDPLDDAAIGDACLKILSRPTFHARLAKAAQSHAQHFSWPRYAERSVSLYRSLSKTRLHHAPPSWAKTPAIGPTPVSSPLDPVHA